MKNAHRLAILALCLASISACKQPPQGPPKKDPSGGWVDLGDGRKALEVPGKGVVLEWHGYKKGGSTFIPNATVDQVRAASEGEKTSR